MYDIDVNNIIDIEIYTLENILISIDLLSCPMCHLGSEGPSASIGQEVKFGGNFP